MSETVIVKGYGDSLYAPGKCGNWYARGGYHFWTEDYTPAMMHALIDNCEAIEKLLETAQAVEVTVEAEGELNYCASCRTYSPQVTLTAIPADPWPADAIEVWRVKRGVQSKYVWQYEPDYWRDEDGTLGDSAVDALPRDWRKDAPNLVWERVR